MDRIGHYIAGRAVAGTSGRHLTGFNRATGEPTHQVELATVQEINQAVTAATAAAPAWAGTSLARRAEIMFRIRDTLDAHRADIAAADAAVSAGYGSAGERCMAVSVVVAVGAAAGPLVEAITERLPALRVGAGDDPDSQMGPLTTREHRDKVASYLDSAAQAGGTVIADGREHDRYGGPGFFPGPSLIDNVTPGMARYRDEIFGPVLSVVRADSYEEAMRLLDASPWGNGAAIFTRDGGAARRFKQQAPAGMIGVNVPIPVPVGHFSFGGWKQSLFRDTHIYGPESISFCTRGKIITERWPDPAASEIDLGFPRTH